MISTVADFLEQFKEYALSQIESNEKDVKHKPTIGDIFEGLTKEILTKSIFEGLELKIVQNSFIYNSDGEISKEIDCMLVTGEGQKISFTESYKYHLKDVIAVFQVKKRLFASDLSDSYQNLLSVKNIFEYDKADNFILSLHRDAYKLLLSKDIPTKERYERFSETEKLLYHIIKIEAFLPLRIVIGYYGYSNEYSLREGFAKNIEKALAEGKTKGYGPNSFPNLIICKKNSLIKLNGMPMGKPFTKDRFYWNIMGSTNEKPMYYLLELIWTRLAYKFKINPSIFGDDFDLEGLHPFLNCCHRKMNDFWVWEYDYIGLTKKTLSDTQLNSLPWEPIVIEEEDYIFLYILSKRGPINIDEDKEFNRFIQDKKLDSKKFIQKLTELRLIYLDESKVSMLLDDLVMVIAPDGKIYAGENKNGQMENFFAKRFSK